MDAPDRDIAQAKDFIAPPAYQLSLIHISEPTRQYCQSRMPSSA